MALFFLRKLILQSHIRSHPVGLDVWFLAGPFVYFHTLCVRTAKALARLRGCAGSPEPSLVAYVISTIISWAGSFDYISHKMLRRDMRNLLGIVFHSSQLKLCTWSFRRKWCYFPGSRVFICSNHILLAILPSEYYTYWSAWGKRANENFTVWSPDSNESSIQQHKFDIFFKTSIH